MIVSRSLWSRCLFLLLVVLQVCAVLPGLAAPTAQQVPNFAQVDDNIYRGAAPTAAGLKVLQAMGVRTIIDLRIERKPAKAEQQQAEAMGFTWINLRMGKEAPTKQQVATFLDTLANAEEAPVFVHCQHGADRTGCMIGIYRVTVQGWSFDATWKEMRSFGFKPYLDELKGAVKTRAQK